MPEPTPRIIYEFGPFRLDFQRHAITKSGQPVSLPLKAFDILVMLLDRRDTLVSKTDLLNHIWPNLLVEENNLAQHVSLLRKTLGQADGNSRYIETVPRVGYRFVGEVRLVHNGHENGAAVELLVLQPPLTERPQRPRDSSSDFKAAPAPGGHSTRRTARFFLLAECNARRLGLRAADARWLPQTRAFDDGSRICVFHGKPGRR